MDTHISIMELLDKLKDYIIQYEKNEEYYIWEGCYTSDEYDFKVRHSLSKQIPETSWKNLEHENMLCKFAIDSHITKWKMEYLSDLFFYYKIWENIK